MTEFTCQICGGAGASKIVDYTSPPDGSGRIVHPLCLIQECGNSYEYLKIPFTKSSARGYLAGIIDGEGHTRRDSGRTEICNNDIGIIARAKQAAEMLGITTSVRAYKTKPGYSTTFSLSLLGGKWTIHKLLSLPMASKLKLDRLTTHAYKRGRASHLRPTCTRSDAQNGASLQ